MSVAPILGALIAGLLAGGHCLAMCGGIVAALSLGGGGASARFPLAYNLGRVASYTIAGALVGGLGAGALSIAGVAEIRVWMQAIAGIALVLLGLRLALDLRVTLIERAGQGLWRHIAPLARPLLPARSPVSAFAVGMIWGWLPCGMAYSMLLIAALNVDAVQGAMTMAAFGIGTLPVLVAVGGGAQHLAQLGQRRSWRVAAGASMAVFGTLAAFAPWLHEGTHHPALAALLDCAPL